MRNQPGGQVEIVSLAGGGEVSELVAVALWELRWEVGINNWEAG